MSRTSASAISPVGAGDRLIEQRQPVAHRAVGGAGDQRQAPGAIVDALGRGDLR